jgi:hypothetical protein
MSEDQDWDYEFVPKDTDDIPKDLDEIVEWIKEQPLDRQAELVSVLEMTYNWVIYETNQQIEKFIFEHKMEQMKNDTQ